MNANNEEKAVARLSELLALECGVCSGEARIIHAGALLHDIGKTKLPGSLIYKPGQLDKDEFELMKTHTVLGEELLESFQGCIGETARVIARWHHEWYNGGGYWGKRLCDLPRYVAYVSIADVYVALVTERVYKRAWPRGEALDYIQSMAGTQFSPWLAEVFISLIETDKRVTAIFGEVV